MKNLLLSVTLMLCCYTASAQMDSVGIARVNKQQGFEIYVLSEPMRPYTVVGRVDNVDLTDNVNKISDAVNGTNTVRCKTILENVKILLQNGIDESKNKKRGFTFDALITDDGTTGTLIKFK